MLGRTFTTKTDSTSASSGNKSTTTNGSTSTSATDRSLMSGASASGMSYTSAGSLARKKEALYGRAQSAMSSRRDPFVENNGSQADFGGSVAGISYHSSHASGQSRTQSQVGFRDDTGSMLGGLVAPKPKKSGFFKKIIETAKTGAASARSTIASGESPRPGTSSNTPNGRTGIGSSFGNTQSNAASDMGLGGNGNDWVQVRRDVNRSNSLSRIELVERKERCLMMDYPAISPVEELYQICDGDEGANGHPVAEPTNFQAVNLSLVDKNARFINSLPPMTNPVSLATGFVCRPYRSDVQRLRAIFTWVSEKITWEDDFEAEIDPRRVIQTKRGCAEEVAILVTEMCVFLLVFTVRSSEDISRRRERCLNWLSCLELITGGTPWLWMENGESWIVRWLRHLTHAAVCTRALAHSMQKAGTFWHVPLRFAGLISQRSMNINTFVPRLLTKSYLLYHAPVRRSLRISSRWSTMIQVLFV